MNAETTEKIENATEAALFDFWGKIVEIFPDAKSGDFPPDLSIEMSLTMERMVKYWLIYNLPEGNQLLKEIEGE
jgi:hypothetical protein